jgi:hypothetical protein
MKIDTRSFQLGMINCFVEMVACGVKRLAISPPLSPGDYGNLADASEDIVRNFGVQSYLEKSLLVTDLQSDDFTRDKWSVLYYKEAVALDAYLELKRKKGQLEKEGRYDKAARADVSRAFMRLLSYPDDVIEEKLSQAEPTDPYIYGES